MINLLILKGNRKILKIYQVKQLFMSGHIKKKKLFHNMNFKDKKYKRYLLIQKILIK